MSDNKEIAPLKKSELSAGGSVSGIIPQSIEEAFRVATAVSKAGMAPYGMDTPEKCLIAIMSGSEVGLPPMQAIQNIAVINNRPCMWGDAVIGVVRASGFSRFIKESLEGEGDDMVARCTTQRIDEDEPVTRTFSVQDAIKAGLWQTEARVTRYKKGGGGSYEIDNDSPWYKHPKRMLQMRARAYCLRDTYADVLKGLQVREEVQDFQPIEPKTPQITDKTSEAGNRYSKSTTIAPQESDIEGQSTLVDTVKSAIDTTEEMIEDIQEQELAEGDHSADTGSEESSSLQNDIPHSDKPISSEPTTDTPEQKDEVEKTPIQKATPGLLQMFKLMIEAIDGRGETSAVTVKTVIEDKFESAKKHIKAKTYPKDVMDAAQALRDRGLAYLEFSVDEKHGQPLDKITPDMAEMLGISEDEVVDHIFGYSQETLL